MKILSVEFFDSNQQPSLRKAQQNNLKSPKNHLHHHPNSSHIFLFSYSLQGDKSEKFTVNPNTGQVSTAELLDYDEVHEYHLNITATDMGFNPKFTMASLTVIVGDTNDNAPTFNQTLYKAHLPENSPPNSFVFKVIATDIDSPKYAVIQYKILGGSGREHFQIHPDTGIITSKMSFDYEEANEKHYTLDIAAVNSEMVGSTTVEVKVTGVNEFYPKFIQPVFHMGVSENAEVGTSVGAVQATDEDDGDDGMVYYLFLGAFNDRGFSIDQESGVVRVARRLDRETQSRVVLTALAKNAGQIRGNDTDETQVIISIHNDNDANEFMHTEYDSGPAFDPLEYVGYVFENEPAGKSILTFSADSLSPNRPPFTYRLIGGIHSDLVTLDKHSGVLKTTRSLDRETTQQLDLLVIFQASRTL